jgi:hypothetical protein
MVALLRKAVERGPLSLGRRTFLRATLAGVAGVAS